MTKQEVKAVKKPAVAPIKKDDVKSVYDAIWFVMSKVGYVQLDSAKGLPYTFLSEAAVVEAVRPHLVEIGLMIFAIESDVVKREQFLSAQSKPINVSMVRTVYRWYHAPTGTFVDIPVIGEGMDSGDKATNKAYTVGMKYNVRQTLYLVTGDDPDETHSSQYEQDSVSKAKPRVVRQENHWEENIVDKIVDLGLAQAKPHAVNILNMSIFRSVPYGDLNITDAVAYAIGWEKAKETFPDDDSKERAGRVNTAWLNDEWKAEKQAVAREIMGVENS